MRRITIILPIALLLLGLTLYCIPTTRMGDVFIASSFRNVTSALGDPHHWLRWDSSLKAVRTADSAIAVHILDTTGKSFTITSPQTTIRVASPNYLQYDIQTQSPSGQSRLLLSVIPYVGNGQPRSQHNSTVAYSEATNLLFKCFAFLHRSPTPPTILGELRAYLEDPLKFYGFVMRIDTVKEKRFITRKEYLPTGKVLAHLPAVFQTIDRFIAQQPAVPGHRNISFGKVEPDGVELLAGINIDHEVSGNDSLHYMEFPNGQIELVGHFQGAFRDRTSAYRAMEKYLLDHELIQNGAPYEKYLSPLPSSDSGFVNITLHYPLRY